MDKTTQAVIMALYEKANDLITLALAYKEAADALKEKAGD